MGLEPVHVHVPRHRRPEERPEVVVSVHRAGGQQINTDVGKIFGNTKKYLLLPLPEEAVPAVALPAERVVLVAHLEAGQPPPAHCLFLKIGHLFECITLNITQ